MPKYLVNNYFAHGSFPEVGQKQKTERKKEEEERLNDGDNNGQATHGARKHAWSTQAAWANREKVLILKPDFHPGGQVKQHKDSCPSLGDQGQELAVQD